MEEKFGERQGRPVGGVDRGNSWVLCRREVSWGRNEHFVVRCVLQMWKFLMLIYNQFQPRGGMSVEVQCKEQALNRRQIYKMQKLQQINQIYYCECGKNYLTFSALYLHARNKHEVKLTTKRSSQNCKVEKKEEKIIVTYFIHAVNELQPDQQSQQKSEHQNSHIENQKFAPLVELIHAYLAQEKERRPPGKPICTAVLEHFALYFQQLGAPDHDHLPADPDSIPLYFNDFACCYMPLAHHQKAVSLNALGQTDTELINFWRWLRERNYTTAHLMHRSYPGPPDFARRPYLI